MLGCCMPTVRVVGGRGNALFNIRISYSSRLASKLAHERLVWPLCSTITRPLKLEDTLDDNGPPGPANRDNVRLRREAALNCSLNSDANTQDANLSYPSTIDGLTTSSLPKSAICEPTFPADNRSIPILKAFLSCNNIISTQPTLHTANTIRSLYHSAEARSQLGTLSAKEFSALISLFGSLSLSTPGRPYISIYAHPLTTATLEKGSREYHRSYWPMVARLVSEKFQRAPLGPSDHYYSMHAQLAGLLATLGQDQKGLPRNGRSFLSRARYHYIRLTKFTSHSHAILPYLHALLQLPECADEAIGVVRNLILRQSYSNPDLLYCLSRLASLPLSQSTETARSGLLESLSSRLRRTITAASNVPTLDIPDASQDTRLPTVDDLLRSLMGAISCDIRTSGPVRKQPAHLLRWSLEATFTELSLRTSAVDASSIPWTQLQYIDAAYRASPSMLEDLIRVDVGGSWSWKAICVLARLKKLLEDNDSEDYYYGRQQGVKPRSVRNVLRALWYKWTASHMGEPSVYHPVSPVIVASFLDLAGRIGDLEFMEISWTFLQRSRSLSNRNVVVEYCIAAVVCGLDAHQVLSAAFAHLRSPSHSAALKDIILRLVSADLALALEIRAAAEQSRLPIESDALYILAQKLVVNGKLEQALIFVSDLRLGLPLKLDLLTTILQSSLRVSRTFPMQRLFTAVSKNVYILVRSHQPHLAAQETLEESILLVLTLLRPPRFSSALKTIHRFWPGFFSRQFLIIATEELIRQRQFHAAARLLGHGRFLDEDSCRKIVLSLIHGGASKTAAWFFNRGIRSNHSLRSLRGLVRLARFQHVKTSRLRVLKLPMLLSKSLHPTEITLAMRLLASAGRVRSSKLLFETRKGWPAKANHAVIGNTLIHASMMDGARRRQAQQMRTTLQVMNRLVNEQGFVPDRVTVNILIKAILRWNKAVDAGAVRALFDRMVRSGYSTGDAFPPGVVPFGTDTASGSQFQVPELTSPISYTAHVRPLYKMFAKALYARRDVNGAKRVVGILKRLEAQYRLLQGQRVLLRYRRKHKYAYVKGPATNKSEPVGK